MTRAAAIFCFWGLMFSAKAQLPYYHAQVFGEVYGISTGAIFEAFEDTEGFIWIFSYATLQRFDGRNVQRYAFPETLSHAFCDADGQIWALAGQGIWRNRADWKGFEKIPFDTSGGLRLRGIFQMKNSPVMALTTAGLFAWQSANDKFEQLGLELPKPGGRHHLLRLDTCGGVLFYPVANGVCAYNMASGEAKTLPYKYDIYQILAVTPDLAVLAGYLNNSFWLDFKRGEVRPLDAMQYGLSTSSSKMNVEGCLPLGDGRFLMNTLHGLCVYDVGSDRFQPERVFSEGKPLGNNQTLKRIFRAKNGLLWAITSNSIVAIRSLENSIGLLRNYHFGPPGEWNDVTHALAEDRQRNLWMGSMMGFKKLNLRSGAVTPFSHTEEATDRLNHPFVRALTCDEKYLFLGPTFGGLWLFDLKTGRYRRPVYARDTVRTRLETDFIDHIGAMRNGDQLISGRFFLYRLKAKTYRVDFVRFPGDNANMNTTFQDSKNRIWVGTERSIVCLDAQYRFLFQLPTPPGEALAHFFEKNENELLVGTSKGLRKLILTNEPPKLEPIPSPMEGIGVNSIFQDDFKRWWFGTVDGLFLADAELAVFQKFDHSDNLQSYSFNAGACLRASNGMLFLGGSNGVNYFYPEKIAMHDQPLAVSFQSLSINDGDSTLLRPAGQLRLPFSMNTLTFEVVAPYFNNAGKVKFRYRLAGHTRDWVACDGSTFRLPNLPAGNYRLEIEASTSGKTWFSGQKTLEIEVLPPFWQTWWFRLLAFFGVAGLLAGVVFFREKKEKQRQQRVLEIERLKSENLQFQLETEQVINFFNRSIAGKNVVDDVLWDVAQQCIARLGWEDCVIYLLDPARQVLVQKAAWGDKSSPDRQIVSPIEIPVGQGIVGAAAATGQPQIVADTAADPRYLVDDAARQSELAVPMLKNGQVIGVIDSEHSRKNFFTPWHLQLLTAIASLCANKIALIESETARQNALLEAVNNQRKAAEAKLQSMRLQMNPHFLFNALNSIQQLILTGNSDGAATYLSKFSKLLRLVLTHSDRDFIHLREELEILHLYLELESLRFDDTFSYSIDCPKGLEKEDFRVPPLLIQPFVENAIWHGLLQKEGKRTLRVAFENTDDDRLRCTIEDNGIGRAAAQAFARNGHTGRGLSTGEERIETLNRQYGQRNSLEIKDLISEDGAAAGTRVSVIFD